MVAGHFAVRQHAVALPIYLLRQEGRPAYRLLIEPPVEPDPGQAPAAAALDVTRRISESLARQVRAHPGQWLWLHDRWRHALRVLATPEPAAPGGPGGPRRTAVAAAQGTNGA
jgi:lauroyl/myristoyl acyltransferase